ncbi:hypothetical protein EV359DRAFT_63304 [Lentinula novae-zelandiae]|nr:hypothetical protein EV359DRAFT_63304 [Lentinula novae-zelandiae]
MHLNPTYIFLGLVSAALSISSTCAIPLNASSEDSLAITTRAPVQNTVPVNSAGPVGSLAMRTSTRDTEPVEAAISLAIRENPAVDVHFLIAAPSKRGGYVRNTAAVRTEVQKVVEGYWTEMGLSGKVLTTLKNSPQDDYVDNFHVFGSVREYFHRVPTTPTTWTNGFITWQLCKAFPSISQHPQHSKLREQGYWLESTEESWEELLKSSAYLTFLLPEAPSWEGNCRITFSCLDGSVRYITGMGDRDLYLLSFTSIYSTLRLLATPTNSTIPRRKFSVSTSLSNSGNTNDGHSYSSNAHKYNRRSPRGSMLGLLGTPEDDRAPSEHVPGGFDDNPRAESSESGPVVSYGELMREMAPKLSNTSQGKGKRTVTAAVPRIGTASNVPSSGNMNENYPQTDRMRPRVSNLQSSNQETNEILPSESASQVGIPNEESRLGEPDQDGDRETHVSTSSSLACTHQYQQNLRRRVALEMLRRDDIMRNSKSIIPEQGIEVEDDFGYDPAHPNIRINWKKISETELLGYRKKYPEINRRPTQKQRQGNHHNHQTKQGFGKDREQNNAPRNIPSPNGRIPNKDQSPPPPDPNHFQSGVNRGGHGAGGGPPGEPPGSGGGGDDQGSDGEPDRSHRGDSRDLSQPIGPHRYGSEDPNATIEETFEYDPTPRSEEEVLRASF